MSAPLGSVADPLKVTGTPHTPVTGAASSSGATFETTTSCVAVAVSAPSETTTSTVAAAGPSSTVTVAVAPSGSTVPSVDHQSYVSGSPSTSSATAVSTAGLPSSIMSEETDTLTIRGGVTRRPHTGRGAAADSPRRSSHRDEKDPH